MTAKEISIESMTLEELQELKSKIEALIAKKQPRKLQIELGYHRYKGSGKCWVARVDPNTKKILGFVDAESVLKDGNHQGTKVFLVPDGHYLFCQSGSKSTDNRRYVRVVGGEDAGTF